MMDPDTYLYKDVVISPFYPPLRHWNIPSLVGGITIKTKYLQHHQYFSHHPASLEAKVLKHHDVINEKCIYGGFIFDGYGHFIRESLASVYFIKKFHISAPIVFSYSVSGKLLAYQKEIFELLDIKNKIILIKDITKFSNIYCPPPGSLLNLTLTESQSNALGIYECQAEKNKYIYISRKYRTGRTATNEDQIERLLQAYGWEIVYPEKLKIVDQLRRYATASKILSICGSALYSLLFLKNPISEVFVLPRNHGIDYEILANSYKSAYYLIDMPKQNITGKGSVADKSFEINIDLLKNILDDTNNLHNVRNSHLIHFPNKPKIDFKSTPEICFTKKDKIIPANSLLWLINYSLHTTDRIHGAKKALYILLMNNWLQSYMVINCYEFIKNFAQEFLLLFHAYCRRLKLNNIALCLDKFKDQIIDSFCFPEIDSFSPYLYPSYKDNRPLMIIETHISNLGWIGCSPPGWINGDPSGKNKIEAIRCRTNAPNLTMVYKVKTR